MKSWARVLALPFLFAISRADAGNTLPYQKARELAVKQCLETVNSYSNRFLEATNHGVDSTWNTEGADGRVLSFFVSKGYFWGDSQVNMQFVPNGTGGCDAVLTETFVLEKNCQTVQEEKFSRWKMRGSLNGRTTALENEQGNVSIYLTPAGMASNLCLVTRREVGYS